MGQRVLMIAYHFPPLGGSSGIQRTLRFVQHLPTHGWEPLVLGASPRAFERIAHDLEDDIPHGTVVERAFALDTARHLAIRKRYPGILAHPDRWISWWPHAVLKGMQMIKAYRPQVIWSTYPIPTAHLIGRTLSRLSGLPWVADFRDPMAQEDYPADLALRRLYRRIETSTIARAAATVLTTRSAVAEYQKRYPEHAQRISLIENGFDEESFDHIPLSDEPLTPGAVTLLHSGIVYPTERDPSCLFDALAELQEKGLVTPSTLRIRFRAAVHDGMLRALATQRNVQAFIETQPAVPYRDALQEMLRADGLLVLQSAGCNQQIPAKAYEYLRTARPIIGLTALEGDTADLLRRTGVEHLAPLDSAKEIAACIQRFMVAQRAGQLRVPQIEEVRKHSRAARAEQLAQKFDEVRKPPLRAGWRAT